MGLGKVSYDKRMRILAGQPDNIEKLGRMSVGGLGDGGGVQHNSSHAAWYVAIILSGPPSPDLYANTNGFQVTMFALLRLPLWLVVLSIVLAVESAVLAKKRTQT